MREDSKTGRGPSARFYLLVVTGVCVCVIFRTGKVRNRVRETGGRRERRTWPEPLVPR